MLVEFRYFGQIGELLGKDQEFLPLHEDIVNIRSFIISKYPVLNNSTFSVAINQQIQDEIPVDLKVKEVALLPPFAGG